MLHISYILRLLVMAFVVMHWSLSPWANPTPALAGQAYRRKAPSQFAHLLAKTRERQVVRILVEFHEEDNHPPIMQSHATAITAPLQHAVRQALSGYSVSNIKAMRHTPYMAMTVDDDALLALQQLRGVGRIVEDQLYAPMLSESVPLVRGVPDRHDTLTGARWAVAVVDTGVDATHEFLDEAKVIAEACYSSALPEWSVSSVCPNGESEQEGPGSGQHCSSDIDGCDHGTHVAGIVAGNAAGTHQAAFSGVATEADIIALQVFSRVDDPITCAEFRRPTPCALTSTSDMMRALEYVYDLRDTFRIAAVNLSLGGGKFTHHCDGDDPMAALIDKLRLAGIATIAASGNHGFTDGLSDPACISSTISVGSTTKRDVVSGFSNSAPFLSLVAPGEHIHSATPANGMSVKSGTSMAAPHVAGAFAVLRQASPDATVDELLRVLQTTGVPIVDWRNGVIVPRLDVGAALDVLLLR